MSTSDGSAAANILTAALGHMCDRAATYDKPEGERSMGATVDAFLAVTGVSMTEEQGWLFMALLKAVRSQQGAYRADSYEDGAAYFALAGEAAVRGRNGEMASEVYAAVDGAPSWNDAPTWAQWLAQDSGGRWYWFECPIYADSDDEEWYEQEGFNGGVGVAGEPGERNENWSKTMQARPIK